MTDSAFRPLTQVEQAFKTIVWDQMVKAGEVWIEGAVPFLALPVARQVEEAAVSAITDWAFSQMVLLIDLTAIKFVSAERQTMWAHASEKLVIIAQEQGVASDAYKQALATEAQAFAQFVHTGP